jgi:hypothetical protein
MSDMTSKIEGKELVIRIPLQTPQLSASQKTLVVASSGGFKKVAVEIDGKVVSLNVTATIPK